MSRDDGAASIEARLRGALCAPLEAVREGVELTATAITRRLRDLGEMSNLCLALMPMTEDEAHERTHAPRT